MPELALLDLEIIEETIVYFDHLAQRLTIIGGRQDTAATVEISERAWRLFQATFGDDEERSERLLARSDALTLKWARELADDVQEREAERA